MLISLFWTLAGLVTAGGGLWVAALFLPQLALLLKAALDFLRSPLGTILGVIALGVFLFASGWVSGDIHGTSATKAAWRAADAARAKADELRDAALKAKMKREADAAIATDDTFTKSLDQQVQKNESENSDRPACRRATGDDIKRLLSIQ